MSDLTASLDQAPAERYDMDANPDAVDQVAALLSGVELPATKAPETAPDTAPGGDTTAAEEKSEENDEGEPETEDPEAAREFYAQTFKLSDGTEMTVGEAKDLAQEFTTKQVEIIERENNVMRERDELAQMAQYMNLTPEARAQMGAFVAEKQKARLLFEHESMMAAIPEFADHAVFDKARLAIHDLGREYGVDLSQIADHKAVKMLYDFARLKAGVKSARENVKQIRAPEPKGKTVRPKTQATEFSNAAAKAAQTGNQADKEAAVALLLRG